MNKFPCVFIFELGLQKEKKKSKIHPNSEAQIYPELLLPASQTVVEDRGQRRRRGRKSSSI